MFCSCSPAEEKDLDKEGAILLLVVYGHNIIGSNVFAGLCVVACTDIPRLSSGTSSLMDASATERKNLTLPLFLASETLALRELDDRYQQDDKEAADFWKAYRRFLENTGTYGRNRLYSTVALSSGFEKIGLEKVGSGIEKVSAPFEKMGSGINFGLEKVGAGVDKMGTGISTGFEKMGSGITAGVGKVGSGITSGFEKMGSGISSTMGKSKSKKS